MQKIKQKTRYWWIFKQGWFSICSIHGGWPEEERQNCNMCQSGAWHNLLINRIMIYIHKHYPKIYQWIANIRY